MNEEKRGSFSRQMPPSKRLSALIRGVRTKGHRKVLSEGILFAARPRDFEDEMSLRKTRSAVNPSPFDYQEVTERPLTPIIDDTRLYDQLRPALKHELCTDQKFVPRRTLEKLVTQESVDHELSRIVYLPTKFLRRTWRRSIDVRIELPRKEEGAQHEQASDTAATVPPDMVCYQKIFAILVFVGETKRIWSFVDARISDADLPLTSDDEGILRLLRKCLKKSSHIDKFLKCQWWVLAPFFGGSNETVPHCESSKDHMLPFTYWEDTGREGGFGRVYRAIVHPEHHEFDKTEVPGNVVAVKKIRSISTSRDVALHELKVLRNLHKTQHAHDHLVTLLATYEQRDYLCLVLPWADADLDQYWRRQDPRSFGDGARLSAWLKQQCCGLAEAVSRIHRYETTSSTTMLRNITSAAPGAEAIPGRSQSVRSPGQRDFVLSGRHGDIKPKNILWFPHASSAESSITDLGILKLSDFGSAHFGEEEAVSAQDKDTVPFTESYQSPECQLPHGKLSPQCDVWALGCVFLEFVCWYSGGHELLNNFRSERDLGNGNSCFFVIICEETSGTCSAELNPPVVKMVQKLRDENPLDHELLHVLDVVEKSMLLILDDTPNTGHSTGGTDIAASLNLLRVTQQAGHGRRRSVGNIARELGPASLSSQE